MDTRIFDTALIIASQANLLDGKIPSASSSYIDGNEVTLIALDGNCIAKISLTEILDYRTQQSATDPTTRTDYSVDIKSPEKVNACTPEKDSEPNVLEIRDLISDRYPEFADYLAESDIDDEIRRLDVFEDEHASIKQSFIASDLFVLNSDVHNSGLDEIISSHSRLIGFESSNPTVINAYLLGKSVEFELSVFHQFKEIAFDQKGYDLATESYEREYAEYVARMQAYEIAKQQFELRRDLKRENSRRRRDAELLRQQMNPGSMPNLVGLGDLFSGIGDLITAPRKPKEPVPPNQDLFYKPLIPRTEFLGVMNAYYCKFSSFEECVLDKHPQIPPQAARLLDYAIQAELCAAIPDHTLEINQTLKSEADLVVESEHLDPHDEVAKLLILRTLKKESRLAMREILASRSENDDESSVGFTLDNLQIIDTGISLSICTSIVENLHSQRFYTTVHLTSCPEFVLLDWQGLIL